ncbi:MAG: lysylphosphatidylglycerol synthase transmembrane domain-containing protein [Candidatus Thermoplasmatota archaeon]|nr:lysylphosphatidylglycerol synthase transmembrane domain-containing protein [Candidatus Thermoplasmatota archaeon]
MAPPRLRRLLEIRSPTLRALVGLALGAAAVWVILQFVDPVNVWAILTDARPDMVVLSVPLVLAHYLAVGYRFSAFYQVFADDVPEHVLVRAGIVSSAVNRAIGFAGVVVTALRIAVVKRWGGLANDVVAATMLNQVLSATISVLLTLMGLVYTFGLPTVVLTPIRALFTAWGLLLMAIVISAILVASPLGQALSRAAQRLQQLVMSGPMGEGIENLRLTLADGVRLMRDDPPRLAGLTALLFLEAMASVATLYMAFWAIGDPLSPGLILLAYGAAGVAKSISMVPGNLGLQEGSMAGVLAWLGIPWEQGVAGVLLFRALVDWAPALLLLPLAWGLGRPRGPASAS